MPISRMKANTVPVDTEKIITKYSKHMSVV